MMRTLFLHRLCLTLLIGMAMIPAAHAVGPVAFTRAQIAQGHISPDAVNTAEWHPVQLDDSWRRQTPCKTGAWTYLVHLHHEAAQDADLGILIHRAGNRLHLWVNQERIATFGALENDRADYSNAPLYARFPARLLHAGTNRILVQVSGDCRRYSGLSQFEIGSHKQLEPRWQTTANLFVWQSMAIISICGILAIISFGISIWRKDQQSLIFAILSGVWALRAALWAMNELPFGYEIWFFLIDLFFGIWIALTSLLAMQACNVENLFLHRLQWGSLAIFCLTSLASVLGAPIVLKGIGLDLTILASALGLASICRAALRNPDSNKIAISIAGTLMLAVGVVDHWNIWFSTAADAYHRYYLTPMLVMFYILSMGVVLAKRFEQAMQEESRHQHALEREIARQRAELERQHGEAQSFLRQEAAEQERQQIVREMYDGLGNHLADLLNQVKNGQAEASLVELEIQEALNQLRYTMDTLSYEGDDLTTILAQFRFHNQSRFAKAGIKLQWHVTLLPEQPWERQALLSFGRMLKEIFSNIIKHSGANVVTVKVGHDENCCHISIHDNGKGCDLEKLDHKLGLEYLKDYANDLGAALHLQSGPGNGMTIRLDWKVPDNKNELSG